MFRAQLSELNEEQRERVDSEMQRVMDRFMGGNQTTSFILFCLHCEMAANSLQGPVATAKKPGYPQLPGPEGKKAEQNIKT